MIEGEKYIEIVKTYFDYLITEFGFEISNEKIRSNFFYDLQYTKGTRTISISYENIENYLQVIVFILSNGDLPDYDDKTKTLHLSKLNAEVLSNLDKDKIDLNKEYFVRFATQSKLERKLLKSAKELRLCLNYAKELQIS
jgi:hypothetical protein